MTVRMMMQGRAPAAGGGAEFPWTENWTGTNGDPWSASKWDEAFVSNGTLDIQSNAGRMAPGGSAYAYARARADMSDLADVDALVSVSFDSLAESYWCLFARAGTTWDSNNLGVPDDSYRVELNLNLLTGLIIKTVGGTDTQLATFGLVSSAAKRWVRLQCEGTAIRARVWFDGSAEPGTWTATATDSSLSTGKVGLGLYNGSAGTTRTATVDDLLVEAL